jgi:hypothetical protein
LAKRKVWLFNKRKEDKLKGTIKIKVFVKGRLKEKMKKVDLEGKKKKRKGRSKELWQKNEVR